MHRVNNAVTVFNGFIEIAYAYWKVSYFLLLFAGQSRETVGMTTNRQSQIL